MRSWWFAILAAVVVMQGIWFFPEVTVQHDLNDNVYHLALCQSMLGEIKTGGNPIDHWVPYWTIGFPVFHHYQHLPHFSVVLLHFLLFQGVSLSQILHILNFLLLAIYPLILFFSLRWFGFEEEVSFFAALLSLTVANQESYGLEISSYLWRGYGMFAQLWAMILLPFFLASLKKTAEQGRYIVLSAILLWALTSSQVMFGWMAVLTVPFFLFLDLKPALILQRGKRLLLVLLLFGVMIAYFLLPAFLDGGYQAHSLYDSWEKWESYGAVPVIRFFLAGKLFDLGRSLPILTGLVGLGLFWSFLSKTFPLRFAAGGFVLWFPLYFGQPVWGWFFKLLPLSSSLHLHRLIVMVHFFGVILAGYALARVWHYVKDRAGFIVAGLLVVVLLVPLYYDRYLYCRDNTKWIREDNAAYQAEKTEIDSILAYIKSQPSTRVHPGRRANWGNQFEIGQVPIFNYLAVNEIPALSYLPFTWALAADYSDNFNETYQPHYDLFNVGYFLTEDGRYFPPFGREVKRAGRFRLYKVATTGYFDLVQAPVAVYGDKDSIWNLMILWLRSPWVAEKDHLAVFFDHKQRSGFTRTINLQDNARYLDEAGNSAGVFETPERLFNKTTPGTSGKIILETITQDRYVAEVEAARKCYLLFKMTFHPGWHVTVDGAKKEAVMLSPCLTGVALEQGRHRVEFVYRPQNWKMPLLLLGLIVAAGAWFWERKR